METQIEKTTYDFKPNETSLTTELSRNVFFDKVEDAINDYLTPIYGSYYKSSVTGSVIHTIRSFKRMGMLDNLNISQIGMIVSDLISVSQIGFKCATKKMQQQINEIKL
jgi:hypothetical protein